MSSKSEAWDAVSSAGENTCHNVECHECGQAPNTDYDAGECVNGCDEECNYAINWTRDGEGGLTGKCCGMEHLAKPEDYPEGIAAFLASGGSGNPPPALHEIDEELYVELYGEPKRNAAGNVAYEPDDNYEDEERR